MSASWKLVDIIIIIIFLLLYSSTHYLNYVYLKAEMQ